MNTRIRYSRLVDGTLVSMRVITGADGKEYRSYILPNGVNGVVKAATKDEPLIAEVKGTSAHKVKIALKTVLQALGCKFAKESRGADA